MPTVPIIDPKNKLNRHPSPPKKAPMQPINFTSPNPMASFFKKNSTKLINKNKPPMPKQTTFKLVTIPSKVS